MEKLIWSIGIEFSKGGGPEAVFLQGLHLTEGNLYGIQIDPIQPWTEKNTETGEDSLDQLATGMYLICLFFHATAYLKTNETTGYFFDPNTGITSIEGKEQGLAIRKFAEFYFQKSKDEGTFDERHAGIARIYC